MASIGMLGFVKGASRTALDAIDKREEEDSKKKLFELQERLRRETSEIEFKRAEAAQIAKEERELTRPKDNKYDPATGKVKIFDSMGRIVSERDATKAERDEYDLGMQDKSLSLDVKRADIRQRDASANYSNQAAKHVGRGSGNSLDSSPTRVGDDFNTMGQELLGMRRGAVDSLKAHSVDPLIVEEAAATALRAAMLDPRNKTPQQVQAAALKALDDRLNSIRASVRSPKKNRESTLYTTPLKGN